MRLVDVIDNGSLYMTAIKDLTGSEGTSAERMRKLREKKRKRIFYRHIVTHLWHGSYVEKELELDIEKELDIDIEIDDNEKISKITKCYEDNIGLITPAAAELIFSYLKDFKDYRIINEAIKTASIANIRTAKYINGILRSWLKKDIKY